MPDQWTKLLKGSAITAEDAAKNPQAVLDVLEFYTEQTKREAEEYGTSHLQGAVERRSDDRWAALLQESKKSPNTPIPSSAVRTPPPRPAPPPPLNGPLPDCDVNEMMDELSIRQAVREVRRIGECVTSRHVLIMSIRTDEHRHPSCRRPNPTPRETKLHLHL